MGGAVSQGVDNDDIINKLKGASYITTASVEKVFRLVDRGNYIIEEDRKGYAYKDTAWRRGNLHLSAPCIYAQVLEGLQLDKGLSFLNLGSGTGYLSTMAGLILGPYGVNHGVELHGDVIAYARERLETFMNESGAVDVMDFCKPQFVQGNAYLLEENNQRYDRVYCGAALMPSTQEMMQNLIKVGGFLVVPVSDQLLQIERISETIFNTKSLLPVSFSSLIRSSQQYEDKNVILPQTDILSLQEMCRLIIRQRLRNNVEKSHADLEPSLIHKVGEVVLPTCLIDTDDSDEMSDNDTPRYTSREQQLNALIDLATTYPMVNGLRNKDRILFSRDSLLGTANEAMSAMDALDEERSNYFLEAQERRAAENEEPAVEPEMPPLVSLVDIENERLRRQEEEAAAMSSSSDEEVECERHEVPSISERPREDASEDDIPALLTDAFDLCLRTTEALKRGLSESSTCEENAHASSSSLSKCTDHKAAKREKFDSGIGDEADSEAALNQQSTSDSYSESDSDNECTGAAHYYESLRRCASRQVRQRSGSKTRRQKGKKSKAGYCYSSSGPVKEYTQLMCVSIKGLPLPVPLKVYINYNRNL